MVIDLTTQRFVAGRALIEALDNSGLPIRAAFWFHPADAAEWKLGLAPQSETAPRAFYSKVQSTMKRLKDTSLALDQVVLFSKDAPLLQHLRTAIHAADSAEGIPFVSNAVNGVLLPDMVIYRNR